MGKGKTNDKRSMRHTPQNKIRSIERNLLKCEMSLLALIDKIEAGVASEEIEAALKGKKASLEAHILHLKRCMGAWSKAKP